MLTAIHSILAFSLNLLSFLSVCAINVAQRLHLDWTDHILWSLSLSPDLASVHRCWLYCAFATSTPHPPTWYTIVPRQTFNPQFSDLSSIILLAASQMSRLSASSIAHAVSSCISSLMLRKSMINRNRTDCSTSVSCFNLNNLCNLSTCLCWCLDTPLEFVSEHCNVCLPQISKDHNASDVPASFPWQNTDWVWFCFLKALLPIADFSHLC